MMLEMLNTIPTSLIGPLLGAIIGAFLTYYFTKRQQRFGLREARDRAARGLVALAKELIKEFRIKREQIDRAETGHYLVSYLMGEEEFLPKTLVDRVTRARELTSHFDQGCLGSWEEVFAAADRAKDKFATTKNRVPLPDAPEHLWEAPGYRESLSQALKCLFAALRIMRTQSAQDSQTEIDHLLLDEEKG